MTAFCQCQSLSKYWNFGGHHTVGRRGREGSGRGSGKNTIHNFIIGYIKDLCLDCKNLLQMSNFYLRIQVLKVLKLLTTCLQGLGSTSDLCTDVEINTHMKFILKKHWWFKKHEVYTPEVDSPPPPRMINRMIAIIILDFVYHVIPSRRKPCKY